MVRFMISPNGFVDVSIGQANEFTVRAPNSSHKCRLLRGRRYRPARPGGIGSMISRRNLDMPKIITESLRWGVGVMKNVAAAFVRVMYGASAFAITTAVGVYLDISSWIVTVPSLPSSVAKTRHRSGRRMAGLRRAHRRRRGYRRHRGGRRAGRGYLKRGSGRRGKGSGKHGVVCNTSCANGFELASVRGGGGPSESKMCERLIRTRDSIHVPMVLNQLCSFSLHLHL